MLLVSLLILLTLCSCVLAKIMLDKDLSGDKADYLRLKREYENALQKSSYLKKEKLGLEASLAETIALYDVIRDIRRVLDEDKMFELFREHLKKAIKAGEYLFLKQGVDLTQYKDRLVLPLVIENDTIGYLAADNLKGQDEKDKFYILAQQFQAGLRGATLFKKVQGLTIIDSLTEVFNRRYFLERLNEEADRTNKFKLSLSFLMVDVDHFKDFNDNYGHLVGDVILKEITKAIKENIRQIDFLGRYGGEELSVVLVETGKEGAALVAERIRQAIEAKQIKVYDENLKVTISIGVSTLPDDALSAGAIIERADEALYQAKNTGRNKISVYAKHG